LASDFWCEDKDSLSLLSSLFLYTGITYVIIDFMKLPELLRAWRQYQKLTLKELSKSIGIPFQTLHSVEKGNPMALDTYLKIQTWIKSK
jgi:DNA-binding XRE family transcriptional regulator